MRMFWFAMKGCSLISKKVNFHFSFLVSGRHWGRAHQLGGYTIEWTRTVSCFFFWHFLLFSMAAISYGKECFDPLSRSSTSFRSPLRSVVDPGYLVDHSGWPGRKQHRAWVGVLLSICMPKKWDPSSFFAVVPASHSFPSGGRKGFGLPTFLRFLVQRENPPLYLDSSLNEKGLSNESLHQCINSFWPPLKWKRRKGKTYLHWERLKPNS